MESEWLSRALEDSRARGFLGPAALEPHVEHARGFAQVWEAIHPAPPQRFLDMGSGGGLPGLVLLERWASPGVLLDSMERRTSFLTEVLARDGAPRTGEVVTERAEIAARMEGLAESFDLVVVRSFGPPSRVAECATRFLSIGGVLIVSEPPGPEQGEARWNVGILQELGLRLSSYVREDFGFQVMTKVGSTPDLYPRSTTSLKKRPLF